MDDIHIPAEDQAWIDDMVNSYRLKITNLYRIAYIAGALSVEERERDRLRSELTNAERFAKRAGLA